MKTRAGTFGSARTVGAGIHRSRSVAHSVPKRKHLRRTLSIPNPLIQCVLSAEIASSWADLSAFCAQSQLSLSAPKLSVMRAVEATHSLNEQPFFRAQRSVGTRYLLKTDNFRAAMLRDVIKRPIEIHWSIGPPNCSHTQFWQFQVLSCASRRLIAR